MLFFTLFANLICSSEQTVPSSAELPANPPKLTRSKTQGAKIYPTHTPIPDRTEDVIDGVTVVVTRNVVRKELVADLLDEFPDSIRETISQELDKLVN